PRRSAWKHSLTRVDKLMVPSDIIKAMVGVEDTSTSSIRNIHMSLPIWLLATVTKLKRHTLSSLDGTMKLHTLTLSKLDGRRRNSSRLSGSPAIFIRKEVNIHAFLADLA